MNNCPCGIQKSIGGVILLGALVLNVTMAKMKGPVIRPSADGR